MIISLLFLAGCSGKYEPGDYYKVGNVKGVVVQTDDNGCVVMLMSLDEAVNIDADSAARWVETLDGDGWRLPGKSDMEQIRKYKSLINKTLERKELPTILTNHTFYWTATPCSDSHTYACGPDGLRCYFNQSASPFYRARGIKTIEK